MYQRQPEPDLYIRASNGATLCVGLSMTDYATQQSQEPPPNPPLLSWQGLLDITRLIDRHKGK